MDKVAYYEEMILNDVLEKEASYDAVEKIAGYASNIGLCALEGAATMGAVSAIRAKRDSKKKGETKEEARKRMRQYVAANSLAGAALGAGMGVGTTFAENRAFNRARRNASVQQHKLNMELQNLRSNYKMMKDVNNQYRKDAIQRGDIPYSTVEL